MPPMTDDRTDYIYDPASADERRRLELLERLNDPATISHFEGIGVGPGWRCLEIGGGSGSVARWLSDRVGSDGKVVATDLDIRFLEEIDAPNVEVRRHDVLEDDLEEGAFDLVHSRFLLEHLPRYRDALKRMVAAVAPGGWVVVEDVDFAGALFGDPAQRPGFPPDTIPVAAELAARLLAVAPARGIQPELGRHLPALLAEEGLEEVGGEGRTSWLWTGTEQAELGRLSLERVTAVAAEAGVITQEERARYMAVVTEPGIGTFSPLRFGAWGRRPAG
jgi:2-polyprenyl-3-methyl-5-hydroxy-6-metoxy-1,4-benzoquinol methylase